MSEESKILDLNAVQAIRDWVKDNFITKNDLTNLGLVSQLYVTFDEDFVGQTYTISGGDKTYSGAVPESLEVILPVNTPSTAYTVTCPNDEGVTCTCEISVGSQTGRYAGKLECFKAYLHIQAAAGAAVTATIGGYSYTGTAGEDGYCTLTVKRKGTYAVVITIDNTEYEVSATTEKAGENIEVVCGDIPVKMVNWSDGTDAQIARMIDAARAGTIDLQTDGGWKIGDTRRIHIQEFDSPDEYHDYLSVHHSEQDVDIVISSFEDYENCGCKMQFDFKQMLAEKDRVVSGSIVYDANGYGESKVYKTVLPNLANAFPVWLRNRLRTFTVKSGTSDVENNKLALRSEYEVTGACNAGYYAEGTQTEYYKTQANWYKYQTIEEKGDKGYWYLRTAGKNISGSACYIGPFGDVLAGTASNRNGISPFGCL